MRYLPCLISGLLGVLMATSRAERPAEVSSLKPEELREFADQPESIQALLRYALGLTERGLAYRFGSADPKSGGMDCSGAVSHILKHGGFASPRQSDGMYLWVEKAGNLRTTRSPRNHADPAFRELQPGDLLFWEGTYDTGKRNPPISHVMMFLGHLRSTGAPVMVGASSGRYYSGKPRHGVSVFDFSLPKPGGTSRFVGYGPVPGLEEGREKVVAEGGKLLDGLRDLLPGS